MSIIAQVTLWELHSHHFLSLRGTEANVQWFKCYKATTSAYWSCVWLCLSEGNGFSQLFIKWAWSFLMFVGCFLHWDSFSFNALQLSVICWRGRMMRRFHDFFFFQFITVLFFTWCTLAFHLCRLLLQPSSKLSLTLWPGPVIELAFAIAISHAGSHSEFHHVRQHDKRQGLICIHEALRKFKEKLQSRMERAGSPQTVQTVSVLDITVSP